MLTLVEFLGTPYRPLSLDLHLRWVSEVGLIGTESPEIAFLVNCAGFGKFGETSDMDLSEIKDVALLNRTALACVTSARIPPMPRDSHTIEICSASVYLPLKELNVYTSTKAFVRSFCNGLGRKLSGPNGSGGTSSRPLPGTAASR